MNYYKLLEISQTATEDEIREAIKKQRRNWNQRANNPKAEIRMQAEKNVSLIREAEKILLDSTSRANYDRNLVDQPPEPVIPVNNNSTESRDWIAITIEHFLADNYNAMNYAAREATTQYPNNSDAWYWRGVSSARLQNKRDADYELHEAIRINPSEASYYGELGDLYCFTDLDEEAVGFYRQAINLDNANQYYQVALARSLFALDRFMDALKIVEAAYELDKNDDFCKYIYARILHDVIVNSWSAYPNGFFRITNTAQLEFSKTQFARLISINCADPDLAKDIAEIKNLIDEAEAIKMHKPLNMKAYVIIWVISILLFLSGVGSMAGIGFLALAISITAFIMLNRVPGWKWIYKLSSPAERNSGIQVK